MKNKDEILVDELIYELEDVLIRESCRLIDKGEHSLGVDKPRIVKISVIKLGDDIWSTLTKLMVCTTYSDGLLRPAIMGNSHKELQLVVDIDILTKPKEWKFLAFCVVNKVPMTELSRKLYA